MRSLLRRPLVLAVLGPLACATADREPTQAPVTAATPAATAAAEPAGPAIPQVSDDPVVQRVVELGHTDSQVQAHLKVLTHEIGPRLTSSHNLMRAETWTRDQFAGWGLQARLEQWGTVPVGFDRGPWSGGMVSPEKIDYEFITRAWTPGHFDPKPAKATSYPKDLKEAKANKDSYAGTWVVRPRLGDAAPSDKVQEKIDALMEDAKVAGYVVSARDDGGLVHTGGNFRIDWTDLPDDVTVSLRNDQFVDLQKRVESGQNVELGFSIDNRFFNGPVPQNNVIADIPGTEKPDEYVIVGGHIDSWDGAQGAVDNGTGVATTMEAARLLMAAGAKPKRTIRFMLWGGEEQGLLGSRAYVEQHPELMSKVSVVLVHDGGTNYLSGIRVTPDMRAQVEKVFAPVQKLAPDTLPFEIGHADGLQTGGSDHSSFIRAGVPGFFWVQDGRSDYNHMHHTQHDTFETAIAEYQRHSAMVVAIAAYNFANLDQMLERRNSSPIERRSMGVQLDGMKLESVEKDSLADKAGLKAGDEIVELGGAPAKDRRAMWRAFRSAGDTLKVKVQRRGKTVEATIDFSQHEGERERARRRKEWTEKYGTTYESDRPANAARDAARSKKKPEAKTKSDGASKN